MLIFNNELIKKSGETLSSDTYFKDIYAPLNFTDLTHFNFFIKETEDIEERIIEFLDLNPDQEYIFKYRGFNVNDQILINGYLISELDIEKKYKYLADFKFFSYLFNPLFLYEGLSSEELNVVAVISDESYIAFYYHGKLIDSRTFYSINEIAGIILSNTEYDINLYRIESIITEKKFNQDLYTDEDMFIYDELIQFNAKLLENINMGINKIQQIFDKEFIVKKYVLSEVFEPELFNRLSYPKAFFQLENQLSVDDNYNIFDVQKVYFKDSYFYLIMTVIALILVNVFSVIHISNTIFSFNEEKELDELQRVRTEYSIQESKLNILKDELVKINKEKVIQENVNESIKNEIDRISLKPKLFFTKEYKEINLLLKKHNLMLDKLEFLENSLFLTVKSVNSVFISNFILDLNQLKNVTFEKMFYKEDTHHTILELKL